MTVFDYAGLATSIQPEFREFGRAALLRKAGTRGVPKYNPVNGPPGEYPIIVIDRRQRIRDSFGTLVAEKGHSLKVSTEGLDVVQPEKADKIFMDGREFAILEVRPVAPGGVVVVYDIELEG